MKLLTETFVRQIHCSFTSTDFAEQEQHFSVNKFDYFWFFTHLHKLQMRPHNKPQWYGWWLMLESKTQTLVDWTKCICF